MATTPTAPIRTTVHAGLSLLRALWTKAGHLIREQVDRPRPSAPNTASPEYQGMIEVNDTPLVTSDADADAFDELSARSLPPCSQTAAHRLALPISLRAQRLDREDKALRDLRVLRPRHRPVVLPRPLAQRMGLGNSPRRHRRRHDRLL